MATSKSDEEIMQPISESLFNNDQYVFIEPTMMPSAKIANPISLRKSTLDQLLGCHDQQFVCSAYTTLLGRDPDHDGMTYYLGRLRAGFSKMHILSQLYLSDEAKIRQISLPGLDSAIKHYQKTQYPLIGWLFNLRGDVERNNSIERKLRSIENLIFISTDESCQCVARIEQRLIEINKIIERNHNQILHNFEAKFNLNLSGMFQKEAHSASFATSSVEEDSLETKNILDASQLMVKIANEVKLRQT